MLSRPARFMRLAANVLRTDIFSTVLVFIVDLETQHRSISPATVLEVVLADLVAVPVA